MNLSGSGASASVGDAQIGAIIPLMLTGYGTSVSAGTAVITTAQPPGSVSDFAVWRSYLPDPAMSQVTAEATPDSTGRTYLRATAPTAYTTALGTLWNRAAFVAATGTWQEAATANTLLKALTSVQLEHAPATNLLGGDAADYRDQMLYTQGSTVAGGVSTWDAAVTRVTGHALSGPWCAQLANTGALSHYSMAPLPGAMAPVIAGATYQGQVSLSIARTGALWSAEILWFDASYNLVGSSPGGAVTHPGALAYQQASVVGVASGVYGALVPVITPLAVGDGELAWADEHRLTSLAPTLTGGPQPYAPARQQLITLHANRINYVLNPSFANDLYGWWSQGGSGSSPATWDSSVGRANPGAAKMSVAYSPGTAAPALGTILPSSATAVGGISPGRTGGTYTLSVYLLLASGCPTLALQALIGGPNGAVVQGSTTAQSVPDAEGWYRLSVTVTVPPSLSGALGLEVYVPSGEWVSGASVGFWADDALVEASSVLGGYFDASLPSPDYLWEATAFRSRSHYYQDMRFLEYRLDALLVDALPVGVPYQVLYAQPNT